MGEITVRRKVCAMSMVVILVFLQSMPLALCLRFESLHPEGFVSSTNGAVPEITSEQLSSQRLVVDLMPYHHENSPFATPNLTLAQRVAIAVESSQVRSAFFNFRITGESSQGQYSSKVVSTSPVYSNQGSYLMQIQLGTPARTFVTIADTGSDLVWLQCTPCTQCYSQPNPYFDPSQSSTYATTTCSNPLCNSLARHSCTPNCQYQYAYGDQSTTQGAFALETVSFGTTAFGNFGFGCGTRNQGTFIGTDGLVGLGRGPVSLVSQLGSQFGNVFSYCLVDFYSAPSKTSNLIFGGTGGTVSYTPLLSNAKNPSFYYVNLQGIAVGGTALSIPSSTFTIDSSTGRGGFILDSGTTVTQLQMAAYVPMVKTLASLMNYQTVDGSSIGFDLCYDFSGMQSVSIPTVSFLFENLSLDLPPQNVFLQVDNAGHYCLAMQGSNFGFGIFGNVQQQNINVAYDLATQQIGFAMKTC